MAEGITSRAFHAAEGLADWRVIGDGAATYFRTGSFTGGARLVRAIGELPGIDDHSPDIDLRADGVTVRLLTVADDWYGMTQQDIDVAQRISAVASDLGIAADASMVQSFLVIPGAPVVAEVLPFWRAILGYEHRPDSPEEDLVDPRNRLPGFWFETMKEPRPGGRGAIHVAVWVPHDQAETRVAAALAAGGRIVFDKYAPAWWTLADAAGNEADIATVTNRD